ncbi:hypothetical protein LOC68_04385 [Blastopirellula sp. JC732]|uniref:Uncharacterized protein n=1 Tax=Blastopirellula sediminis TaxID=2894196 RepID=A0A9X1MJU8_9BACT|nr:hypothetical protein [Blastopirellula sediminis]MCC9609604.1 hypothetical protein [Blastopirellula sediminis]MCC9627620.1 hypothetical protein [Blastopirellula sediminis]
MSFLGLRSLCVLLVCIPTLCFADNLPGSCVLAAYSADQAHFADFRDPLAKFAETDWVQAAIRDCVEPNRTKPADGSQFAINVAKDHAGAGQLEEATFELELAWQKVSRLFWNSPENPEGFQVAQFDIWMKGLTNRALAGWLPSSGSALEPVTDKELAEIEQFILDEDYASAVAARPVIATAAQDDCPPMPPTVERVVISTETIAPEVVEEIATLLEDEEAPLTDEEIAYLHSGPSDFVISLDPYGYSEYNDYLKEKRAESPKAEQGAAWSAVLATQIVALTRSSNDGIRWIGSFDLSQPIRAARQIHQEREIRGYRTAERQLLERWDAVIDGFQVLR